mmetsp:Transcript_6592/g.17706  ORF Transcript_6592/g.17706 Transcript_6592/m.17706 type:complete len:123 (+) Transcript_6592:129-497(+)
MGNTNSKEEIWFYLVVVKKGQPYKRMGPFRFEAIAQVYKEEQITDETYVWTNAKFTDPKNHRKYFYMDGYSKVKDMPLEFHKRLQGTMPLIPDRRGNPDGSVPHMTPMQGYDYISPPQMPAC